MKLELLKVTIYLAIFWIMQVLAQIFFKWGSVSREKWITGFLLGNLFGFSSMWLLMMVYKVISPNVALALGAGGAFLFTQIAFCLFFKTYLTFFQWIGILSITLGMIIVTLGE